jgi:hypothetical protein
MSGTPPTDPQVTIDSVNGSTSIYCTVDGILTLSLSFLGKGFFWNGRVLSVN